MERANEKSIELTAKELDAVTGGKLGNGTLPFNPFSRPRSRRRPSEPAPANPGLSRRGSRRCAAELSNCLKK